LGGNADARLPAGAVRAKLSGVSTAPVRVFHCDDSRAFTELVRFWLADHPDLEHVGAAHDAEGAVAGAAEQVPDVVVLDTMGAPEDASLVEAVRAVAPAARVIVYSGFSRAALLQTLGATADAVLTKGDDERELVAAIHAVVTEG
jgi:DNA-binding NarL/FixJ family response regulator